VNDTGEIELDATACGIVEAAGSVWVTDFGGHHVYRVDPIDRQVSARIRTGSRPCAIDYAKRGVWVANYDAATVQRIDTGTERITDTIEVGAMPWDLQSDGESVWITEPLNDRVRRVDAESGKTDARIGVASEPHGILLRADELWTPVLEGVAIVDTVRERVMDVIPLGDAIRPGEISEGFGDVWVGDPQSNLVYRIDADTRDAVARIEVGYSATRPTKVGRYVGAPSKDEDNVSVIDPTNNSVVAVLALGSGVFWMEIVGDHIWMPNHDEGSVTWVSPGDAL
jgi:YVTN family beta-propeller protein